MSVYLDRFRVCCNLSEEFKKKIKTFHVFDYDVSKSCVLFITSDDEVFSFGYGSLPLIPLKKGPGCYNIEYYKSECDNNSESATDSDSDTESETDSESDSDSESDTDSDGTVSVREPKKIPELCHKNIQQFFIGRFFELGITSDNQVYGWGNNTCGQLGRGYVSERDEYLKAEIIEFPLGSVIQLTCGAYHTLALTCDGKVYGWGDNTRGQIGCGREKRGAIHTPIHLKNFSPFSVKILKASADCSYALTVDGLVYSWGSNYWSSLGHDSDRYECVFEPKLIVNIPKMIMICPSAENAFLLSEERDIYSCGFTRNEKNEETFQITPKIFDTGIKFNSLHSACENHITALSDNTVYEFHEFFGYHMNKSPDKTFFDFYSLQYQMCYKTIQISSEKIFDGNDLSDLQNYKCFKYMFDIVKEVGKGGYGKVYQVKNKFDLTKIARFAIKEISFKGEIAI